MEFRGRLFLTIAFFLMGTGLIFSQGDRCSTIQPFCAGDAQLVFPNSNAVNNDLLQAESGPYYDCLLTQPYPAWFYLQIANPGDLEFTIIQSQNPDGSGATYDVDFIVWGPFGEGDDFCSNSSLSFQNKVDCSYSPSAVERMTIPDALQNEIYVVLITNFSGAPGYISLQQTNSSGGSTDCSIVGSPLGPDQKICGDSPVVLDATNSSASEYIWYVFNESTGEYEVLPNETGPTLTVSESGNYQVTVKSDILNDEASDDILIEFFEIPVANPSSGVTGCKTIDGVNYDLTDAAEEIIGNNTGNFTVNFYLSTEDYENGEPIDDPENFDGGQESVLGTIVSEEGGCESEPVPISLKIGEGPEMEWNEITAACLDLNGNFTSPISLGKDLGPGYIYDWNISNDPDGDGRQNPVLVLSDFPSSRIINLTVTEDATGCSSEFSTELKVYSPPREIQIEITGSDFEERGYTVTANASGGFGDSTVYEYRLDNGPWQPEPVFKEVPAGSHQVTAREINGCGMTSSRPFRLIGYPRFFTPNNDGYNDTWKISNSDDHSIKRILIFDRYGKLLKQLNTSSSWDGTFNDQLMPADDYWFLVEFKESGAGEVREFKGHFTLKR